MSLPSTSNSAALVGVGEDTDASGTPVKSGFFVEGDPAILEFLIALGRGKLPSNMFYRKRLGDSSSTSSTSSSIRTKGSSASGASAGAGAGVVAVGGSGKDKDDSDQDDLIRQVTALRFSAVHLDTNSLFISFDRSERRIRERADLTPSSHEKEWRLIQKAIDMLHDRNTYMNLGTDERDHRYRHGSRASNQRREKPEFEDLPTGGQKRTRKPSKGSATNQSNPPASSSSSAASSASSAAQVRRK